MGLFTNFEKKNAGIDRKFKSLGFVKKEETDAVIVYAKKNDVPPYNHIITISRRFGSDTLVRSEDRKVNTSGENNSIPMTASVMALVLKKIKARGFNFERGI